MKLPKRVKLKKGDKVYIDDIVRFRFSSGVLGAGQEGTVVRIVENQSCVYVEMPDEEIYWYDSSEVTKV